ncbi:MAG: hypothetical protein R6V10_08020 [bacterium]
MSVSKKSERTKASISEVTRNLRSFHFRLFKTSSLSFFFLAILMWGALFSGNASDQVIFPGRAHPRVSRDIIRAYNHALEREYEKAREICLKLGRDLPDNPAAPTGEMVLYQVMMLENDDFRYDRRLRDAAVQAEAAARGYENKAEKTDWYYTLLGASYGIKGIYHLRRQEYLEGAYLGITALRYLKTAKEMNPKNYEARMGIGVYLYYRSAYSRYLPLPWLDRRDEGIAEVKLAGEKRDYLNEVSRIALYYIYVNEKDYQKALSYMDGLIEERPGFPVFYQLAGRALMEKGDYKKAYSYYDRMRRIDPELYLPYFKLGECSLKLGRKKEAKRRLEKFFRVLGDRESVHRKPARKYLQELEEKDY